MNSVFSTQELMDRAVEIAVAAGDDPEEYGWYMEDARVEMQQELLVETHRLVRLHGSKDFDRISSKPLV